MERLSWLVTPKWLARIVWLLGFVSLISAISPPLHRRLLHLLSVVPNSAPMVAEAVTALVAIILMALARNLRLGKRRAWVLATGLVTIGVALHLVKGLDVEEAIFTLVVLVLLLLGHKNFHAASSPRTFRRALAASGFVLLGTHALGVLLLTVTWGRQDRSTTLWDRVVEAAYGMVGVSGPISFRSIAAQERTELALLALGAVAGLLILYLMLARGRTPRGLSQEHETSLRVLVEQHSGVDSLSYFALRRDRTAVFSPTGKAAVSYRAVGDVCLAGGDPLGDPEAWPLAIEAWLATCRHYGWRPAVLGANEAGALAYQRAGLKVLEVGDEAIVDLTSFSLSGRAMRGVRQAVNRVTRAGVTVTAHRVSELSNEEILEVAHKAHDWREGRVERGFSMALSRFGDPADGDCVIVRARDGEGHLIALLHFVPWGTDGLSLDLMRRDPASENGVMEAMIAHLGERAKDLGIARISLNFAMFRAIIERGEQLGAGPLSRFERNLLMIGSRAWQIDALYRSNAKYLPQWSPRYLCFATSGDLPTVTVAAMRAESFLTFPSLRRRQPKPAVPELLREARRPHLTLVGSAYSQAS